MKFSINSVEFETPICFHGAGADLAWLADKLTARTRDCMAATWLVTEIDADDEETKRVRAAAQRAHEDAILAAADHIREKRALETTP